MAGTYFALYLGAGVLLVQLLHTYYSHRVYRQKEVRALEWVPGFARDKSPVFPPGIMGDKNPSVLRATAALFPPWKLPPRQMAYTDEKTLSRRAVELLGLQCTNVVYCYLMAVVYGAITFSVVRFVLPSRVPGDPVSIVGYGLLFALLLLFSFLVVGGGAGTIVLEANLVFNAMLLLWLRTVLSQSALLTVLGIWLTVVTAALGAWAGFHIDRGAIDYGKFVPAMVFILLSLAYAESVLVPFLLAFL